MMLGRGEHRRAQREISTESCTRRISETLAYGMTASVRVAAYACMRPASTMLAEMSLSRGRGSGGRGG